MKHAAIPVGAVASAKATFKGLLRSSLLSELSLLIKISTIGTRTTAKADAERFQLRTAAGGAQGKMEEQCMIKKNNTTPDSEIS